MKKLAFILALSVLLALSNASQAATWQEHEAEARQFLAPCHPFGHTPDTACIERQRTFVYLYVHAMTRDPIAVALMPQAFDPQKSDEEIKLFKDVTVPDQVQSCAWAYLIYVATDRDPKVEPGFQRHCRPLDKAAFRRAFDRMKAIVDSIDDLAKPPKTWHPE